MSNESGPGSNIKLESQWVEAHDPQNRPRQYAGNVKSPMYTPAKSIESQVKRTKRKGRSPFIMCEYSFSLGNSVGDVQRYWRVFESPEGFNLQGAFIWQWCDLALKKQIPGKPGETFWASGGDFGDYPNSGGFCNDGLVRADRSAKPALFEMSKIYQNIDVKAVDMQAGKFSIKNKYYFTNLNEFDCRWELLEDGKVVKQGDLGQLDIKPLAEQAVVIPVTGKKLKAGHEYFVTFSFHLTKQQPWAPKGYRIAWDQLEYPVVAKKAAKRSARGKVVVKETSAGFEVTGKDYKAVIGKKSGLIEQYIVKGKPLFLSPLKLNFRRARTNNDGAWMRQRADYRKWKKSAEGVAAKEVVVADKQGGLVRIKSRIAIPSVSAECTIEYSLRADDIEVEVVFKHPEDMNSMPRLGLRTTLPKDYVAYKWYGRGPHESYADRKESAAMGIWNAKLDEMFSHYTMPQENGNHTDVRWFEVEGKDTKLHVQGLTKIDFSAWSCAQEDMEGLRHDYQVPVRDFITLNIDYGQIGVGGDAGWGLKARPHREFLFKAGEEYRYAFRLKTE